MLIKEIFSYIKMFPILFNLFKWKSLTFTFYAAELRLNFRFWRSVDNRINNVILEGEEKEKFGGWIDKNVAVFIYAIIRTKKPLHSLETGVGGGLSSKVILKGLRKNKKGKLVSLDLENADANVYPQLGKMHNIQVPNGYKIGWLIADEEKINWELIVGDSKETLAPTLKKLDYVDFFLHDSLHTDEHIRCEFNEVLKYANNNTIFLCDDVNEYWSTEFLRLFRQEEYSTFVFRSRLGIALKR